MPKLRTGETVLCISRLEDCAPCGCEVIQEHLQLLIVLCPIHAAAPAFREALTDLLPHAERLTELACQHSTGFGAGRESLAVAQCNIRPYMHAARATLAGAKET